MNFTDFTITASNANNSFTDYHKYHSNDYVYGKVDIDTKISIVNNYFIHCLFHKDIEHQKILFYETRSELLIPFNLVMKEVTLYVQETDSNQPIEAYSIIFNNSVVHSSETTQIQNFILPDDTIFVKDQLVSCIIVNSQAVTSNIKKAYLIVKYQNMELKYICLTHIFSNMSETRSKPSKQK